MAARNDDRRDAEYEGADALMAAITGEPLPEGALEDPVAAAEHRAALADVALLREQLGLIGDALADAGADAGAGADADPAGSTGEALAPPGRPRAARSPSGTVGTARPVPQTRAGARPGARPATPPAAPVRPAGRTRPGRRPPLRTLALRGLAAAAAVSFFAGVGWVITQGGGAGGSSDAKSSVADEGAGLDDGGGSADGAAAEAGDAYFLACSRLVVEGTVTGIEPVPGTGQERITLAVERYYKPDGGEDEIAFPVEEDAEPPLNKGDHVLLGIPVHGAVPDRWTVGDREVAAERARIQRALPHSEDLECG